MKTLGILGGVGPDTTAQVYLEVIRLIRKSKNKKHPSIVIQNLLHPFILEDEMIVHGKNSEKMIPFLVDGARILEKAGASFGVLPCNTLHKHINEIRASVKIPFLSIIEETVIKLKELKIKNVGILASQTTINSRIFADILEANKIEVICPTRHEQGQINKIIVELVRGESSDIHNKIIINICESLCSRGAASILLACTDLQLVTEGMSISIPVIDTTDILIRASVRELNK